VTVTAIYLHAGDARPSLSLNVDYAGSFSSSVTLCEGNYYPTIFLHCDDAKSLRDLAAMCLRGADALESLAEAPSLIVEGA
jgi:hypothetical protein